MKWPRHSQWNQQYWKYLQAGDIERAKKCLGNGGVALQTRNHAKQTPLQWVALEGVDQSFEWLISQGATDTLKPSGQAFLNSCFAKRSDYAKTLLSTPGCLKSLATIEDDYRNNIFHAVFDLDDVELFNQVLRRIPVKKALTLFLKTNERGGRPLHIIKSESMMDSFMAYLALHYQQNFEDVEYLRSAIIGYCFENNSTSLFKSCLRHYKPDPAETAHFLQQALYSYQSYHDPHYVSRFFSIMVNHDLIEDETIQAFLTERLEQRIQNIDGQKQLQSLLQILWDRGVWSDVTWKALSKLSPEITTIFEQQNLQKNLPTMTQDLEAIKSKKNVKRI